MARVTLEEIARLAGVSKATVSRVLNDKKEGYSKTTEERVRRVLREAGYPELGFPDNMVGSLRSRSIGLVIPDISNPFFQRLVDLIEEEANEQDYSLLLIGSRHSAEKEAKGIKTLVSKRVDGIILVPTGIADISVYRTLERYQVPCVLVDRELKNMQAFRGGVFIDSVYPIFQACEYLVRHNDSKIVFLSGPRGMSTANERFEGYRSALKQYQIDLNNEMICYGDYTIKSGYECVSKLLKEKVTFDAVIASNDSMAIGALSALKRSGLRVPEDVEVIGFDGTDIGEYVTPPLSTIVQPVDEMAQQAVQILCSLMDGGTPKKRFVHLEAKFVPRGTTR